MSYSDNRHHGIVAAVNLIFCDGFDRSIGTEISPKKY